MALNFLKTSVTPSVRKAQDHYYGRSAKLPSTASNDKLTADEIDFIEQRDSFYLGTVSEDGWPYIQHRGGPPGFLKIVGPNQLGFADFGGNRQLLSTGNLSANDRVTLFLMDYPNQRRLKILGHAQVLDAREHLELAQTLSPLPELRTRIERLFLIDVTAFGWNCPQYITPRYTLNEMEGVVGVLRQRITELEAQLSGD
jgi:uncharacterized protein